jgi:hypothetical protein
MPGFPAWLGASSNAGTGTTPTRSQRAALTGVGGMLAVALLVAGCTGGAAGTNITGGQSVVAPPAATATSAASATQTQASDAVPGAQVTTPAGAAGMPDMPGMEQANGADGAGTQTGTAQAGATPTQQSAGNSGAGGTNDVTEVQATLREWAIDLSLHEVPAGKVRFTVTNQGQFTHNLTIISPSGEEVAATRNFSASDGPQTLEVDLQAGTYTIICSLPGHAARGQRTELTVK